MIRICITCALVCAAAAIAFAQTTVPAATGSTPEMLSSGRKQFEIRCAACHGADGMGGERAPGIDHPDSPRLQSDQSVRDLLHEGIPDAGMPSFHLPDDQMRDLIAFVRSRVTPAIQVKLPGDAAAGEAFFFGKGGCAECHMVNGRGGLKGPDLTGTARERTLGQIEQVLHNPGSERHSHYHVVTVRLKDGRTLRGFDKDESNHDLQLQGFDNQIHLLAKKDIAGIDRDTKPFMPPLQASADQTRDLLAYLTSIPKLAVTAPPSEVSEGGITFDQVVHPRPGDWPTYHGQLTGNRNSPLTQINRDNVSKLALQWMFPLESRHLEGTPIVVDGVMYVTNVNECYAVDARTGRQIWHYKRPTNKGLAGDAASGINRGVAVLGDRVFMVTDDAHLIALHRLTGGLLWDSEMADSRQNYGSTSAPLVVKDLVFSGVSGGDEGVRGFISAHKASTGEEVWRFWTMPKAGEPLASTWVGSAIEHGCTSTWLTGTYDSEADTLFWVTGNPCPDFNGDERKGDNLYSDSVLALEPGTGKLKWYFQFTPHDLHDWDAAETPMLVDAEYGGERRKLLLQGNRNGFFYVLDRTTGKFLSGTPFVHKLNWASGFDKNGRPQVLPAAEPTPQGSLICPSMDGASNWMSTAFNPDTKLFYLMALEKCNIFAKSAAVWQAGESYYGGAAREVHGDPPAKYLRALDVQTGKVVWEIPQTGASGDENTWGGILTTASGLLFYCEDSGAFAALDARDGKPLWFFQTNQFWKASPMTYMVDGKQYVAVEAGSNVLSFALP